MNSVSVNIIMQEEPGYIQTRQQSVHKRRKPCENTGTVEKGQWIEESVV